MKIAIAIHGNLRTFLMPLRENPSYRLCDLTYQNIFAPNYESDVFIVTDDTDFYYNGAQYFTDNKKIEITNADPFRLYPKIEFKSSDICKQILQEQLHQTIPNIKNCVIESEYDTRNDKKYHELNDLCKLGFRGSSPSQIVGHYRKLKLLYESIIDHENKNNFKYDIILKIRFDNFYPYNYGLNIKNYNFTNNIVYVPGSEGNLIYDWYAFGTRDVMVPYLKMYDHLGFTKDYPSWLVEWCPSCLKKGFNGKLKDIIDLGDLNKGWVHSCPNCGSTGKIWVADITLAPEYHLYKMYELLNIKPAAANYYPYVYRYLDLNTNIKLNDIFKNNNLQGIKIINHVEHNENVLTA